MSGAASVRGDLDGLEARSESDLRILAVGNMYPPHHAGGYEIMWQAAVRHARSLGHRVRVLTSDYHEATDRPEEDADVHRTLRWYWDLGRYEFPRLGPAARLAIERHNAAELDRHVRELRPHLVAWWSMGCLSLSLIERVRRSGVPAISIVHDDWIVYGPQHDQWIRIWRGRRKALAPLAERAFGVPTEVDLGRAGPFVFNSRYTLERARAAGLRAADTAVVYPGIGEQFLVSAPARPWAWRLACVGRVDRQKGVDTAVGALAHLPAEARLTIWGTGDHRYVEEMRAQAAEQGTSDRVRFAGWAGAKELPAIYAEADAVLFPVRWDEPFGLVPLEAMGIGRPVVSTARGGTAEFVRDGENALVFSADDTAGLAAAIRRLAEDPELRARLREAGVRTAARYTIGHFAELTVAAIERAARLPTAAGDSSR